ncbi:hypothetical protein PR048_015786 [Dryococelus australis]|uniref:Uncharacterized protein n=1 Tax=Dryococelus australis TaxID=614101 RepID=A0ABQ9HHX3_9NEOP|nr:hypothetical protein PR048_015786 [Dryococelus australis]
MKGRGETGYHRETPPASDTTRHNSLVRKSGSDARRESNLVRLVGRRPPLVAASAHRSVAYPGGHLKKEQCSPVLELEPRDTRKLRTDLSPRFLKFSIALEDRSIETEQAAHRRKNWNGIGHGLSIVWLAQNTGKMATLETCVPGNHGPQQVTSFSSEKNLACSSSQVVFARRYVTLRGGCGPPNCFLPRLTGFDSRRGCSRIFACENRAGQYRWSAGFFGDLLLPPSFHFGAAQCSPRFTLIGSQDLDVKSHPKPFIHSPLIDVPCACVGVNPISCPSLQRDRHRISNTIGKKLALTGVECFTQWTDYIPNSGVRIYRVKGKNKERSLKVNMREETANPGNIHYIHNIQIIFSLPPQNPADARNRTGLAEFRHIKIEPPDETLRLCSRLYLQHVESSYPVIFPCNVSAFWSSSHSPLETWTASLASFPQLPRKSSLDREELFLMKEFAACSTIIAYYSSPPPYVTVSRDSILRGREGRKIELRKLKHYLKQQLWREQESSYELVNANTQVYRKAAKTYLVSVAPNSPRRTKINRGKTFLHVDAQQICYGRGNISGGVVAVVLADQGRGNILEKRRGLKKNRWQCDGTHATSAATRLLNVLASGATVSRPTAFSSPHRSTCECCSRLQTSMKVVVLQVVYPITTRPGWTAAFNIVVTWADFGSGSASNIGPARFQHVWRGLSRWVLLSAWRRRFDELVLAAAIEWLDCSPPTMVKRVQFPAGSLPEFRKWESYLSMPLAGGVFSEISHSPHPCIPALLPFSLHFTLSGSQDLVIKSRP